MGPGTDPHSANNPYADAPSPWRNFCCEAVMLCRLDEEAEGGDQPLGEFLTNLRMEVECEVLAVDKSKVSFLNLRDVHQKEVEAFWQKDIPMSLINRIQTVINDLKSMTEEYQNESGEYVDLYIPRKCSASNRIIYAKDHAAIQINFAEVDPETGRMTGKYKTYAVCGQIRRMGESDDCLNRLTKNDGLLARNF
ncbi:unnamed protein product [Cyprideis torosa]|uniref:Small ribosomal subunit protein eS21 n=1 Tax=Cyprideis torosa TaxID=163714 RepID=A0A7R8WFI2_9CRUS|nr:unnamed protein product [Cyprideis torosa]CAG0890646.1 unnamed protein product [Cyprideis torosa]